MTRSFLLLTVSLMPVVAVDRPPAAAVSSSWICLLPLQQAPSALVAWSLPSECHVDRTYCAVLGLVFLTRALFLGFTVSLVYSGMLSARAVAGQRPKVLCIFCCG